MSLRLLSGRTKSWERCRRTTKDKGTRTAAWTNNWEHRKKLSRVLKKMSCREKIGDQSNPEEKKKKKYFCMAIKLMNSIFFPHCGSLCCLSQIRSAIRLFREGQEPKKSSLQQPGKKDILSPVTLTSTPRCWEGGTRLFFALNKIYLFIRENGVEGGWESGERNGFILCLWWDAVTQEAAQPNFFHSCIGVSENLICKLPRARQKALTSCTEVFL